MAVAPLGRLRRLIAGQAARQTGFLFAIDSAANGVDYGFHIYLGRVLLPADFALVQTVNTALLVVITAFAVMQPVVARYVAAAGLDLPVNSAPDADTAPGSNHEASGAAQRAVFQTYFRGSLLVGLLLAALTWLVRRPLGGILSLPPAAIGLSAGMVALAFLRPVVAGMLQGQQRFLPFGLTRLAYAVNRFAVAALLIGLGGGVLAAVAALPLGSLLALLVGLLFLGRNVWRPARRLAGPAWRDGLRLSAGALVAYAAYMTLQNTDLLWVNASFPGDAAGSYAAAVLLRRVLALLPGAAIVVMFPRAVVQVAAGRRPDRLLALVSGVVILPTLALTLLYALSGPAIIRLTFGSAYVSAAPLLGWLGLAMLGYGLGGVWLNFYLAARPWPFIGLLVLVTLVEQGLLARYHETLEQVAAVFGLAGWSLALGGLALYFFWFRPQLSSVR